MNETSYVTYSCQKSLKYNRYLLYMVYGFVLQNCLEFSFLNPKNYSFGIILLTEERGLN